PLYRLKKESIVIGAQTTDITYDSQNGYGETDATGFDRVGNRRSRTSAVSGVSSATYGYDNRDRMATLNGGTGDNYDDNGNTTGSGGLTYTYDFENHLVGRNGTPSIQIVYDGDGNRVKKIVGTTVTLYL